MAIMGFPGGSVVKKKTQLPMQEMCVWSLGREDPLEKAMATHSSILAWEKGEEPGGLQSVGSQRVRQDWSVWKTANVALSLFCYRYLCICWSPLLKGKTFGARYSNTPIIRCHLNMRFLSILDAQKFPVKWTMNCMHAWKNEQMNNVSQ